MIHHTFNRFRLALADYCAARALGLELHGYRVRVMRSFGMLVGAVVLSGAVVWFAVSTLARFLFG